MNPKISADHLKRRAIVYIRQSSPIQVTHNLESQRRQYNLADQARQLGFQQVEIIDEDLGRSGSGQVERPGFERLVVEVCSGQVGAVFCIEASRLARNGRDWHHLIELCGLVRAIVIDPDGVYDPGILNDRLLLGLKGTMSEFELNLLRQRSLEAIRQKARRGELQFCLPVGYRWTQNGKIEIVPDRRVQQESVAAFEAVGDRRGLAAVLSSLGTLGDGPDALRYLNRSLAIRREIGDRQGEVRTLGSISAVEFRMAEHRKARESAEAALELARKIGFRHGEGVSMSH